MSLTEAENDELLATATEEELATRANGGLAALQASMAGYRPAQQ